jgi:putative phage-type endonuclease
MLKAENVEIVHIPQGTPEWLEWRKGRLCGSDAPAVIGASPWSSPYDVWADKVGSEDAKVVDNFAVRHGTRNEHIARTKIEQALGVTLKPVCIQWTVDGVPYGASLDGANEDLSIIAELKCPLRLYSPEKKLPNHYKPQTQHQMIPINPRMSIYAEYYAPIKGRDEAFKWFELKRDEKYIQDLIKMENDFWRNHVQSNSPPEKLDAINLNDDERFVDLVEQYEALSSQLTDITDIKENVKLQIIERYKELKHKKVSVAGHLIQKIDKKGSVDYAKLISDKKIEFDEEKYRKKGSSYVEVRFINKKAKE